MSLARNYAAGKDMLAGVKRTYKGQIVGEDYTKWPDQLDFSAELAKIGAAKPDGIFIFYPGAHGVQFVKQWVQAGLNKTVPLYQVFSIDAITLPQQGDLALGTLGAAGVGRTTCRTSRTSATSPTSRRSTTSTRPTTARRATTRSC